MADLERKKEAVQGAVQDAEKVGNANFVRLDLWQLISALEAEGESFDLMESAHSAAATEIALLREMVVPALTGIGQPLLEECAVSFEKVRR